MRNIVKIAVLTVGLGMVNSSLSAGEGRGTGGQHPDRPERRPHGPIAFILGHSAELKLTDEQKTKVEALAKSLLGKENKEGKDGEKEGGLKAKIDVILTDEQKAKLKTLRDGDKPENPFDAGDPKTPIKLAEPRN